MKWDEFFIKQADLVSTKSKDPSTKVGVVVVGPDNEIRSQGFNGFPRGVEDSLEEDATWRDSTHISVGFVKDRYERPAKYMWTEHAERNSLYNLVRIGVSAVNCTMYINYAPSAICPDCARAIIQCGIKRVIGPNIPFPGDPKTWEEGFKVSKIMFDEAGIELITVDSRENNGPNKI